MFVHHANGVAINQLDPGNRYAHLDNFNGRAHRRFNAGERTHRSTDGFRQWVQLDSHFSDHAERAFTAHHQARQVVACRRFFGTRASANHFATGRHHFKGQHVFTHGAVAHCVGAAGTRGAHAAQRGICPRIDGEKQTGAFDFLVELLARDTGLHRHRQVFSVDVQHLVHAAHVNADAALHSQKMPFQRRADAKCNDRYVVHCSQLDGVRHIGRAFSKHHGRWRRYCK